MNFKDILDAAFAAGEKEREQSDGGSVESRESAGSAERVESVGSAGSAESVGKDINHAGESSAENAKSGENGGGGGTPLGAIEKAAALIKRLKGEAALAGHDLDVTRAVGLDEVAEALSALCDIAVKKL